MIANVRLTPKQLHLPKGKKSDSCHNVQYNFLKFAKTNNNLKTTYYVF